MINAATTLLASLKLPMDNSEVVWAWILLVVGMATAIIVSFMCSLLESALLSLTPSQLADITTKNPKRGELCSRLKDDIEQPLAVILICNTAAHTIGAAIAGEALAVTEFAGLDGFVYDAGQLVAGHRGGSDQPIGSHVEPCERSGRH